MPDIRLKSFFFDRQKVINSMSAADRAALSKAGAFVRRRAQTSMRRRKASAQAGQPPSAHEGSLRKRLYFAYDTRTRSVVVGPEKYKDGKVPKLMEQGGRATIKKKAGTVTPTYKPHPYMGPALEAERRAGNIPSRWEGSFKG